MARRRFRRSRARSFAPRMTTRRSARRSSRRSSGVAHDTTAMITSAVYGATRNMISSQTMKVGNMLPIPDNYKQPIVNGGIAYLIGRFAPSTRKYTKQIVDAEIYEAGKTIGNQFIGSSSGTSNVQQISW